MWYLIYSEDVAGSLPQRKLARPAHLARLQALQDEGRLLTAGPNPARDAECRFHPCDALRLRKAGRGNYPSKQVGRQAIRRV